MIRVLKIRVLRFKFSHLFFRPIVADINSLVYFNRAFNSCQEVEDLLLQLKKEFFAPLFRKIRSIKTHNERVHKSRLNLLCADV